MKNIAIVEDDKTASDILVAFLEKFKEEKGEEFNIFKFSNSLSFLTNYNGNYDIIFMDIELPDLNGMEAAKKMRLLDKDVILIFVTNMAQFAVKGYEVDAFDFIVKPVSYSNFVLKLQRALTYITENQGLKVMVSVDDGVVCLNTTQIRYIEIMKHRIIYHTLQGDYFSHGTLKKLEPILLKSNFIRCNSCYLVNLRFVTSLKGYVVFLDKDELQISHPKRQSFVRALNNYFGGEI